MDIYATGALRRRLMDMGLTKNARLFLKKSLPGRSNRNYLERIRADTTQIRSANDWCSNHKRGEEMTKHIALAGNPNSGKTTLFNLLTGTNQRVGNWPGVTVERKSGTIKKRKHLLIQDLPGIYSLSPYTPEERVARDYLIADQPAAILNVLDATNLERNLYLTLQLLEMGLPIVIALNMTDALKVKVAQ